MCSMGCKGCGSAQLSACGGSRRPARAPASTGAGLRGAGACTPGWHSRQRHPLLWADARCACYSVRQRGEAAGAWFKQSGCPPG